MRRIIAFIAVLQVVSLAGCSFLLRSYPTPAASSRPAIDLSAYGSTPLVQVSASNDLHPETGYSVTVLWTGEAICKRWRHEPRTGTISTDALMRIRRLAESDEFAEYFQHDSGIFSIPERHFRLVYRDAHGVRSSSDPASTNTAASELVQELRSICDSIANPSR